MSAVISSPVPTELKARLYTWLLLLLVVLVAVTLLWMGTLLYFGILNLLVERLLGYGADETWQALLVSVSGAAYALLGASAFLCMVRGTLREE